MYDINSIYNECIISHGRYNLTLINNCIGVLNDYNS